MNENLFIDCLQCVYCIAYDVRNPEFFRFSAWKINPSKLKLGTEFSLFSIFVMVWIYFWINASCVGIECIIAIINLSLWVFIGWALKRWRSFVFDISHFNCIVSVRWCGWCHCLCCWMPHTPPSTPLKGERIIWNTIGIVM